MHSRTSVAQPLTLSRTTTRRRPSSYCMPWPLACRRIGIGRDSFYADWLKLSATVRPGWMVSGIPPGPMPRVLLWAFLTTSPKRPRAPSTSPQQCTQVGRCSYVPKAECAAVGERPRSTPSVLRPLTLMDTSDKLIALAVKRDLAPAASRTVAGPHFADPCRVAALRATCSGWTVDSPPTASTP